MDDPELKSSRVWQDEITKPYCHNGKKKKKRSFFKPSHTCDRCRKGNVPCSLYGMMWMCQSCFENRWEV